MQWPIFRPVKYEAANLNTTCQRFKVLSINREMEYSQNVIKANLT